MRPYSSSGEPWKDVERETCLSYESSVTMLSDLLSELYSQTVTSARISFHCRCVDVCGAQCQCGILVPSDLLCFCRIY